MSNKNRSADRHNDLLSRLEWEIREDLLIPQNPPLAQFKARLWCSGSGNEETALLFLRVPLLLRFELKTLVVKIVASLIPFCCPKPN